MDAARFDALARSFRIGYSRRTMLGFGLGGLLGTLGLESTVARKHKKHKKKHKKPTCHDGNQNGSESEIDCGGGCPRCANGRTCASRDDCAGALCTGGTCTACAENSQCGTDVNGECVCLQPGDNGPFVCTTNIYTGPFTSCASCAASTYCYISNPGEIYCYRELCGAA